MSTPIRPTPIADALLGRDRTILSTPVDATAEVSRLVALLSGPPLVTFTPVPAYRKFTPAVEAGLVEVISGLRVDVASLEEEAKLETFPDGVPIKEATRERIRTMLVNTRAALEWIEHKARQALAGRDGGA